MTDSIQRFRTPRGSAAHIWCRADTNDRMVAESVIEQDEYDIASLTAPVNGVGIVSGRRYVDIGAHIGAWIIAALLDEPDATGVAVEPLPDNVDMLWRNLAENGITDRVEVIPRAFARKGPVTIHWDYKAEGEHADIARMHRYIGNMRVSDDIRAQSVKVSVVTPYTLFKGGADVVKLDCEGGEVGLIGANLSNVGIIRGEYHVDREPLAKHLAKTHKAEFDGSPTFGAFRAAPK